MKLSEEDYQWFLKAVKANPAISDLAKKALSSEKFLQSAVFRSYVLKDVVTKAEAAQLAKMVWDRFRVQYQDSDAIPANVVVRKLPPQIARNFISYMASFGINLVKVSDGRVRFFTTGTDGLSYKFRKSKFAHFCQIGHRLAAEHGVAFTDVAFTSPFVAFYDSYSKNEVPYEDMRTAFAFALSKKYYELRQFVNDRGIKDQTGMLTVWRWEGKVIRFRVNRLSLYVVNPIMYKKAVEYAEVSRESS